MSWGDIFSQLEKKLGREHDSYEVQNRILEMLKDIVCDEHEGR